jgi:hypothetical protein
MEYHRTDNESCHFGCGLLELVLWRCEEFCGCCGAEKLQVVGEDLVVNHKFLLNPSLAGYEVSIEIPMNIHSICLHSAVRGSSVGVKAVEA